MATTRTEADTVVVMNQTDGITLIPKPTALTRLNYFDGKFLRAADLQSEQDYHRHLQQLAAQAGGPGVVHGFDLQLLAGDQIELAAGLAIDPAGRVLHLPQEAAVQLEDLIARSRGAAVLQAVGRAGAAVFTLCETAAVTPLTPVVAGTALYVIGIAHAEALCGQEDVIGRLCEQGCASGTERPQRLEGVVLRALPLQLASPLPASKAVTMDALHLRSRVASAWFADEARQIEPLISGAGLLSSLWCHGAAPAGGSFVPLAVVARAGGHTVFLDGWTARRERVDGTPRRHWQWRMMMRPWDAYLAQVLQFQCQLRDAWRVPAGGTDDPCTDLRRTVADVGDLLAQLERQYQDTSVRLAKSESKVAEPVALSRTLLADAVKRARVAKGTMLLQASDRVLIRRGIVELPSAGYLPVAPGSALSVNDQVRRLLGEGVDLRFCVVRPDFVAHAMEEAQHMERISLLRGLDNPRQLEEVDILVPDGEILSGADSGSAGWEVRLAKTASGLGAALAQRAAIGTAAYERNVMTGAARSEALADGSLAFCFAGLVETASRDAALAALKTWAGARDNGLEQTLWKSVELMDAPAPAAAEAAPAAQAAQTAQTATMVSALSRKSRAAAAAAAPPSATAPVPASDPAPQALAARYAALRAESVAYQLKTMERVANRATTAGIAHFEGLKDGQDTDHTALWLALRAEGDALAAAEGSRVDVSLELSVISPKAGGTQFIDIQIVGAQFIVESRVASGQRLAVQGTLRGAAIVNGLVGTLAHGQRGLQFSVPALLTSEPTDDGSSTRVEVDFSSMLFDNRGIAGLERLGVRVANAAAGQQAQLVVQMAAQGVELDMAARLQRNEAVLQLGHPLRAASETAIDVLATRESAPNFANRARAELFGERAPQKDALTVRATRDWVLFHRRRNKQCGAAPAAAVAEQRRYELHHLRVKTDAQWRTARAAVMSANVAAIRKLGFAPIGAVTFDGGRSSLATATDALLADWQAAQPGSRIRFGAIGSQGAAQAEGNALAQARLATLEAAVTLGTLEQGVENQVLPVLPALALTGWDGAMFVVTQDVKAICHEVLRVADEKQLRALVAQAARAGLVRAMKELGLAPMVHVDFESDGKTLQPASLLALRAAWGSSGKPLATAVVYHGSSADENAAVARTGAILAALQGGTAGIKPVVAKDLAQATDCAGLSVIVAPPQGPVLRDVLLTYAPWDLRYHFLDSAPVTVHRFSDGAPVDAEAFAGAVRVLLRMQPVAMALAVPTAADLGQAADAEKVARATLQALNYGAMKDWDAVMLNAEEVKDLDGRGFASGTYQQALVFSNRRPQG